MLAIWEYFWNNNPTWGVATTASPNEGGARPGKYFRPKPDSGIEEYRGAPKDYWDVRERYLRRFMEPVLKAEAALKEQVAHEIQIRESEPIREDQVKEGQSHLRLLQQARDAVVERARTASNLADAQKEVARVIKLTLDISALRVQYYERAVIILLLDLF